MDKAHIYSTALEGTVAFLIGLVVAAASICMTMLRWCIPIGVFISFTYWLTGAPITGDIFAPIGFALGGLAFGIEIGRAR
jgi:hypothetical protein